MHKTKGKLDATGKLIPNGKGHIGPRMSAKRFGDQRVNEEAINVGSLAMKRLYVEPNTARITCMEMKQVNKSYLHCHEVVGKGNKSRFFSHITP